MCMVDCCMTNATERGEPHGRRTCLLGDTMSGGGEWANPMADPQKRTDQPANRHTDRSDGRTDDRSDDRLDRFGGKRSLGTGEKIGGETGLGGCRLSELGASSHRRYD